MCIFAHLLNVRLMNAQYCHTNSTKHLMKLEIQPLILIAEDNESNYLLLFTLLKRDYRIIHARDGIEAIRLFKNSSPDIILMDIKMPHMDGLTAMQTIREIDEEVPIIAVSAHAFEQDRRTAYACGCNAYVTKTVDIHELTSIISLLLSIKEHHDSI